MQAVYDVAGTTIGTTIELPGLPHASGMPARWRMTLTTIPAPESGTPYHAWCNDDGHAWLRFFREGEARRLVFPGVLDVRITETAGSVECDPAPRAQRGRIEQLIGHYVVPLLLGCEHLVLHASAIAIGGRVIGFVGATHAGKSTLASYFASRGAAVVSDDALVIAGVGQGGAPTVLPLLAPLRLGTDTIERILRRDPDEFRPIGDGSTAKRAVPADPAGLTRPLVLSRLYLLEPVRRGAWHIATTSKATAIRELMQSAFEMAMDDPARVATTFDRITTLVRGVPVQRLRFAHDYDALAAIHDRLMSDLFE